MPCRLPATLAVLACLAGLSVAPPAAACGPDSDCVLDALVDAAGEPRFYRIRMPEGTAAPMGALIFAHGYRATAAGVMANAGLADLAGRLGVALVALKSHGEGWRLPGTPSERDATATAELAYVDAVLADLEARFDVDPDRLVMAGFSAGGMMTWTLACRRSARFAGFIPVAGTFWEPEPETCEAPPASVVHIHGTADRTVPLAGREIGAAHQGDVHDVLAMYARFGDFGPVETHTHGALACEERENPAGAILDFCTFEGGHSLRVGHLRHAWGRLTAGR